MRWKERFDSKHLHLCYALLIAYSIIAIFQNWPFPTYWGLMVLMFWAAEGPKWTIIILLCVTAFHIMAIISQFMKQRWYTIVLNIGLQLFCIYDIVFSISSLHKVRNAIEIVLDVLLIGLISVGFYVKRKKTNE